MPRKNKVKRAFDSQKNQARIRNIYFRFTYERWCEWWLGQLGPDWFEKRGCKKGQYVMARLDDKGSYRESNVKCILHSDNTHEAQNNKGNENPRAKLTEDQARYIKHSKIPIPLLTAQFKVTSCTIHQIKRGIRWKHLT